MRISHEAIYQSLYVESWGALRRDSVWRLRIAIVSWIKSSHQRCRRQASLGRLTPIEFEAIMTTPATQAA